MTISKSLRVTKSKIQKNDNQLDKVKKIVTRNDWIN